MRRETYNGQPPSTRIIQAGTEFHRISGSGSSYPPNSFNHAPPKALDDEYQGRFEPIDTSHGGYLYVADSLTRAVAEGILRESHLPRGAILRRNLLRGKTYTVMVLERDIEVAELLDGGLPMLGLSATISACSREDYSWSRTTCHEILTVGAHLDGVIYRCRHHGGSTALMLLDRHDLDSTALKIVSSHDILSHQDTLETIAKVADEDFHLRYVGGGGAIR
ncbi:RES domain-containing protein [Rhodococcus hoagii]|nr:RES domain-containing protein [Prescottella equi]